MKIKDVNDKKVEYKHGINNFGDWILHDNQLVLPLLMTLSKWITPIFVLCAGLLIYIYTVNYKPLGTILMLLSLIGFWQLYKFIKLGGAKSLKGMSTNEILWNNKFKLKNDKKKNE